MKSEMADYERMNSMLTVREVAELLHVHPNTVKRWSDRGRIATYRISSRGDRRYRLQDIERFLAELAEDREGAGSVR